MAGLIAPQPTFQAFNTNGSFLAGGLLYTYAAGSSTPQATYTDSTLLTPNTNPVVLNAIGQANVWLTPGQAYKFNLTDSFGNQMPDYPVDQINGNLSIGSIAGNLLPATTNTYDLGNSSYQWAAVYANSVYENGTPVVSFPITTNEQTALTATGGTVVNFGRYYGDVDRYVTNTGYLSVTANMTDCTVAWNTAVAWAMIGGGEVTYGYTSQYRVTGIINCWVAAQPNQPGITIRSIGQQTYDNNFGILANHNLVAVFDCTGNDSIIFRDVAIRTATGNAPQCGILTARNSTGGSLLIRLYNVKMQGSFTVGCYYNYGSEDDVLDSCYFDNESNTASANCAVYTGTNIFSLSSAAGIGTGTYSCIDHTILGCQFLNSGANATNSYCLYIEAANSGKCFSTWMSCGNTAGTRNGSALVAVNGTNAGSYYWVFDGLTGEAATYKQNYGILFFADAQTYVGWSIRNCILPNNTNPIAALTGAILTSFTIENIQEGGTNNGLSFPTVNQSFINTGAENVAIITSNNNILAGYSDKWTITTRSNDYWIDQGTVNKTWTPVATGLTHVGTITITNAECQIWGNQCRVTFEMAAATSLTPTAGQTITGLPFAAVRSGGVASFVDVTMTASLGQGLVSGTTILSPAFTGTTNTVLVDCTYFIA